MPLVKNVHSVSMLAFVARDLKADGDWLGELANGMDPEDGLIWGYGPECEDGVMAFTPFDIEVLTTLICERGSSRPPPDEIWRRSGLHWMATCGSIIVR